MVAPVCLRLETEAGERPTLGTLTVRVGLIQLPGQYFGHVKGAPARQSRNLHAAAEAVGKNRRPWASPLEGGQEGEFGDCP